MFTFVVNAAFEVENRLLESRDGLALWNLDHLEMEALSENAIILVLELCMDAERLKAPGQGIPDEQADVLYNRMKK